MPGWAKNEDVRSGWLLWLIYTPLPLECSSIPLDEGAAGVVVDFGGTSGTLGGAASVSSSNVFFLGYIKIK